MWQVRVPDPLKNGFRVYCHPGTANVSGIGIKAGSIYDPPGMVGMAHFTEHLICRISNRYPDPRAIDLLFRKYMGNPEDSINIRTDRSSTFFGHGDLLRRSHMEAVFDVMASFIHPKNRIVDPAGMWIERAAVHQEYYLNGIDWMPGLLDDLMHRTMYERNPARNRIDCEVEDLQRITIEQVRQFVRRYYVPKNAFAVILGPKVEEAKAMAERYFGDWEEKSVPIMDYDHTDDLPKLSSVRSFELARPGIHQYHCGIGFPTETYMTADAEALDVLANILEVRLNWSLREENRKFDGGSYRTPVYAPRSLTHGLFWGLFATTSREFEARAEDIVLREYKRLKTDLVPQDELETAIRTVQKKYLDAFRDLPGILSEMIICAAANGDDDLTKLHAYRGNVLRVSRRKIRKVADKYFTKNYARVLIKPAP
jgi:predicted Zn-dependent peptidase